MIVSILLSLHSTLYSGHTILENHGHGGALVEDAELALGALLVGGVGKDASVEEGAVGVGDHGANVAGRVGLAVVLGLLEGVEVGDGVLFPVERVALVDRVDGAGAGHLHAGVGEDELADAVVEGEAVDAGALHGEDELGRGAVHGEAGGDELGARLEDIGLGALGALGQLVDGEDGADGNAGVEVGGAVDGVAGDGVAGAGGVAEIDNVLFFLGDEQRALVGGAHGLDEEVVGDDVELLLVVAGAVGGAGEAGQVDEGGAADVVGDGLEGELEGMAEEAVSRVSCGLKLSGTRVLT